MDKKISNLTELAAAPAVDDEIAIVDTSATETKKITPANLLSKLQANVDGNSKNISSLGTLGCGAITSTANATINGITIGIAGVANNTALGSNVLSSRTTGIENTGVGRGALGDLTTSDRNTGVGEYAGRYITTGGKNTAIGNRSLYANTTGDENTAIGHLALFYLYPSVAGEAEYNTAIGGWAGRYAGSGADPNQTSSNSVYIGHDTRASADGNTYEIVIGSDIVGKGSNTAYIGGSAGVYFEGPIFGDNLKQGTDQTNAGASANEIWVDTSDSNTLKLGT